MGDTAGRPTVLVTGGAGYIGAHVLKAVSEAGGSPVTYDNLSLGFREAARWGEFVEGDIRDRAALIDAMRRHDVDSVIHLAGLIEVGRSTRAPDLFWEHNVGGTASLLGAMRECGVGRLVFSSSAAVYGQPLAAEPLGGQSLGRQGDKLLSEDDPKDPSSPYGDTKLAGERMIRAHCAAFGLSAIALRYFNAAGADASGDIGEAHQPETHLIPLAIEAALGHRAALTVFGTDFETPDGTCLRDYIHVTDLAAAHVAALAGLSDPGGFTAYNVGMGRGHSVMDVIAAVEAALGRPVPHTLGPRRAGDPASLVADAAKARAALAWTPRASSLANIVETAARWRANPRYGPF